MWFCGGTKTDEILFLYKITAHKTPYFMNLTYMNNYNLA